MNFFTEIPNIRFILFGNLHIIITIATLVFGILIYLFRAKLYKFNTKFVRYTLASILFVNFIVYYASLIANNDYNIKTDLPLHFCFITNFFLMFILLTNNKHNLYKVIYFFTFIGPLPAILFPDLVCSYDRFIFYQFIISHHFMILVSIFCLCVSMYKVEKKNILNAYIWLHILAGIMFVYNKIFDTNYCMMFELPQHIYVTFPFVRYLPPFVWLELVSIISICLSYIPAYILNKRKKQEKLELM